VSQTHTGQQDAPFIDVRGGGAPILEVRGLSKCFNLYPSPWHLIKEVLFRKQSHEERWALRDVSFDVRRGEIVGVVGANGAGKSTLLKILAGVLDKTAGDVHIRGQLRAILELGTGFQDQYSGRENIYMGGYCLGYSRQEINECLDWIIDFSGLRDAIGQPFRTYSSGMKARLTFAVTFCRQPEIMIVDEALAVGDLAFTNKCVNRIIELCNSGATALVVSHNMFFIERLCQRALYIKAGRLDDDGPPARICKRYEAELLDEFATRQGRQRAAETIANTAAPPPPDAGLPEVPPTDDEIQQLLDDPENKCPPILHLKLVRLLGVHTLDANGQPRHLFHVGEPVRVAIEIDSRVAKTNIVVGIQIFHESGVHVLTTTNRWHMREDARPGDSTLDLRKGRQTFVVDFPRLFLGDGKYYLNLGIAPKDLHFSPVDELLVEKRVAVLGFYRDDVSYKQICDLPSAWRSETDAATLASRESA
jgi:ABC-type polysaccharide/polyol phosphate transport system ATPase subunit